MKSFSGGWEILQCLQLEEWSARGKRGKGLLELQRNALGAHLGLQAWAEEPCKVWLNR